MVASDGTTGDALVEAQPATLGLIARVIVASARHRVLTIIGVAALALWGLYAVRQVPVDAIPDLSDVQVIVYTDWQGRSPTLVEDQITYPIVTSLESAPKVRYVRGQSLFGQSFVNVIFEEGTDLYWARSRVLEYLSAAQGQLPAGVSPRLGPDATGVGWVYEYALVDTSGAHDLADLRTIQDYSLRYALASVPGVAEVASLGGRIRQYQITVDPVKLVAFGISVTDVVTAVQASNQDVGGGTVEVAGFQQIVRGRGYVQSPADLESIPLRLGPGGVPVRVRDVGTVALGPDWDRGIGELNGIGETVGGIVIMRSGEDALRVIDAAKARLESLKASLPPGVSIVPVYDRSDLIRRAVHTLSRTLIEELVVVSLVIMAFLLHLRSALVPIIALPIAVLLAFIPMMQSHLTANIMSLGGIAVAIGAMVDASIIMIENIHRRLAEEQSAGRGQDRLGVMIRAMQEVGPSLFFALMVITISFLPVFTLEGTEGRLFKPLAFTKTYSMGFAALLAITLIPALATLLIRGRMRSEQANPLNRWLIVGYEPVVRGVVRHPYLVMGAALASMLLTVPAFLRLESEFMPPLNEGSILYMPTAMPGISISSAESVLQSMDRQIKSFPEVASVFGKMGSATSATDPAPLSMVETVIRLKPESEWPPGMTQEALIQAMDRTLQYPGMPNIWWMPIQTRTEMLATGIRSALGIKLFGPTQDAIEEAGTAIERALLADPRTHAATRSAFAERLGGGYYLDFTVKREEASRYGLTVQDVQQVIQSAVGGETISQTVEGRARFPISVRYGRDFRSDQQALQRVLVTTRTGAQIPLAQLADIAFTLGPDMVRSESGQLEGFVFIDVTGQGIPDYVAIADKVIGQTIAFPPGVRMEWTGQYEHFEHAKARLRIVVPLTLFIVIMLLYFNTRSAVETAIVMLAVPFSLIGAVWLLYLLSYKVSVAVWVGLIALAGLDAETGVVMLLYLMISFRRHQAAGLLNSARDLEDAIVEGAARRIRPKLMTVMTLVIGLAPVMWSMGTGADVMKRIAAPMVGGIVTSFLLELTVYPAVFAIWKRRAVAASRRSEPATGSARPQPPQSA